MATVHLPGGYADLILEFVGKGGGSGPHGTVFIVKMRGAISRKKVGKHFSKQSRKYFSTQCTDDRVQLSSTTRISEN